MTVAPPVRNRTQHIENREIRPVLDSTVRARLSASAPNQRPVTDRAQRRSSAHVKLNALSARNVRRSAAGRSVCHAAATRLAMRMRLTGLSTACEVEGCRRVILRRHACRHIWRLIPDY